MNDDDEKKKIKKNIKQIHTDKCIKNKNIAYKLSSPNDTISCAAFDSVRKQTHFTVFEKISFECCFRFCLLLLFFWLFSFEF